MSDIFWQQFVALFRKNWIVLSKRPLLNIFRFFCLPVIYGVFLASAQLFLNKPSNFGIGQPIPIYTLDRPFTAPSLLLWVDATDGKSSPSPSQIMSRITSSFTPSQRQRVRQVSNASDIPSLCPENFARISACFGAVIFYDIPASGNGSRPVNYTMRADAGLVHIDAPRHKSDYEEKILPLQWTIDKAIIELQTTVELQTPLELPFTQETNTDQYRSIRLRYVHGINSLIVIAFFVCYVGVAYQLAGGIVAERANGLTAHMKAMGLLDLSRILSWHVSISFAYLPAWIAVGLTWHYWIFSSSNVGLILIVHLLLGLTLASWSFFVAAPFGKSPQLAAVVTTLLSILLAILALVFKQATNGTAFVFTLLFPPGFYIFAIRAIGGWKRHRMATDVVRADPDSHFILMIQLIAALIDVVFWPYAAILLERLLYDAKGSSNSSSSSLIFWKRRNLQSEDFFLPSDVAISVKNLSKTFRISSRNTVSAIADLSFDVPKRGIFVLLGSNGAGKSTTMSIIGGLSDSSGGNVIFEGGNRTPPRGTIGLVPQKDVLFPDLTCIQSLKVWQAVKWSGNSDKREDLMQLLRDCNLEEKAHSNANTMSGGQKRKLQLAVGLVGGSKVVLVDECTSGVDPLSRRSLWRTLIAVRDSRCVVFTTHFLDEADLLADEIAILVAPGKLVAQGTPVALKNCFGKGYSLQVTFNTNTESEKALSRLELFRQIQAHADLARANDVSPLHTLYHLNTKEVNIVARLLHLLDAEKSKYNIASFDVLGTSIEHVFLGFMDNASTVSDVKEQASEKSLVQETEESCEDTCSGQRLVAGLSQGRRTSFFHQAFTVLRKRFLILRRSWLSPFLTVVVAVAGSTIPTIFIDPNDQTCVRLIREPPAPTSLYLPTSGIPFNSGPPYHLVESPPGIVSTLGNSFTGAPVTDVTDNATFFHMISTDHRNLSVGGISLNLTTGDSLVAWEASPPGLMGPTMLNLATNILYNHALNVSSAHNQTSRIINASYQALPRPNARSLNALKWVAFFGAAMSVFPAFFALYVSREKESSVQAMQFSNGLTKPHALFLGHLMFDTIWTLVLSTVIVITFSTISRGFYGLGFLWLVLVLHGIAGALFAYCAALVIPSPLTAFATVAGCQIVMFCLSFAGYLLVYTYVEPAQASKMISIIHWTVSLVSPVANVLRAGMVSINLFYLLCDGTSIVTASSLGQPQRFGGPILYLVIQSCGLFAILSYVASGSLLPRGSFQQGRPALPDNLGVEANAEDGSSDLLQVVQVSKSFQGKKAVDNVSFGVSPNTIFALLGPNGAGKTTTFNMIRGDTLPDTGSIFIAGTPIVRRPQIACISLGVCPQFTAIDAQMTVQEHLNIYGRLKGLAKRELSENVEVVLRATALDSYADRFANKLSGGNQRKLSLAIALLGNPPVLLIDEFSTGIDAKMKRDMWHTLRRVAFGKAVIMTTHSMEEASILADRVGILAQRLLAVGSTQSLCDQHAIYEVHFSCRTREDQVKVQKLMTGIPGSRMADDVATRFEIPIDPDSSGSLSLSKLFDILTENGGGDGDVEFAVGKATLESVFLKVIKENNVEG